MLSAAASSRQSSRDIWTLADVATLDSRTTDAAHAMLTFARRTTPSEGGPAMVRARAEQLPFPDASLDLITATLTCRHWHDVRAGLAEIARVLTADGLFVFADVDPLAPRRR
ncbi:class I SAM-dependent methyltransferase [Nonomuraea sp. 10N515B]|uniref:class I SAM-dependent methyltransferase n=1 Tax=Nonomuraea sp. 10N515B TaxID=3457422 RepID=UPI003FCCF8C7